MPRYPRTSPAFLTFAEKRRENMTIRISGAISAIEARTPDFAIVDFNLGTESSEPVANLLREKGVRFVLATGYAEMEGQIAELGAETLLRKPYGRSELEDLLNS